MNDLYQFSTDVDGRITYPNREYFLLNAADQLSNIRPIYDSYHKEQAEEELVINQKYKDLTARLPQVIGQSTWNPVGGACSPAQRPTLKDFSFNLKKRPKN